MSLQSETDAVDFGFGDIKVAKTWDVRRETWWVDKAFII
jgi:hypothetical protein